MIILQERETYKPQSDSLRPTTTGRYLIEDDVSLLFGAGSE